MNTVLFCKIDFLGDAEMEIMRKNIKIFLLCLGETQESKLVGGKLSMLMDGVTLVSPYKPNFPHSRLLDCVCVWFV